MQPGVILIPDANVLEFRMVSNIARYCIVFSHSYITYNDLYWLTNNCQASIHNVHNIYINQQYHHTCTAYLCINFSRIWQLTILNYNHHPSNTPWHHVHQKPGNPVQFHYYMRSDRHHLARCHILQLHGQESMALVVVCHK